MFRQSTSTVPPCVYLSSAVNAAQWSVSEALKATNNFTLLALIFYFFNHFIVSFYLFFFFIGATVSA